MAKFLFFASLLMIFYIYFGYPALIFLTGIFRNRRINKADYEPYVTILIAAYNEEEYIEATLRNKLDLAYPKDKLEIVVLSDGSTDKTDQIVKKYESQGIKLLRQEPRAGKTSGLNLALPQAKGEILVFSDANSMYEQDALRRLMQNFNDETVGYVTGKMIYTNPHGPRIGDGCTIYMKYENFLRKSETKIGSIVGVDGGIDAMRKSLYIPMKPDQLPDFVLPLAVVEKGHRVVYEPDAVLRESSLTDARDEYSMRVRVSLRALWAIRDMRHLLSIKKFKFYALQLLSHKLLRYLCFMFLIGAYLSNLALWSERPYYKGLFILQNLTYLGGIISPFLEKIGHRSRLLDLVKYFTILNLAAAHAFIKFLLRHKQVTWTPRKG